MLEHSLHWYCITLCRAFLRETHAKSCPSQSDHLHRGSSFGGRTRRQRCSSTAGAASHAVLFATIRTLACDRFPVLCDVLRHFAQFAQHWACIVLTGFCTCANGCALARERILERAVLPLARSAIKLCRVHPVYGSHCSVGSIAGQ